MTSGIPDQVRQQVKRRSGGACERCGAGLFGRPASVHHRRPRGAGGTTDLPTAESLVVLCGSGTTGCHGWVESNRAAASEQGWLVLRRDPRSPGDVPVFSCGSWYLVTPDRLAPVDLSPPF